MQTKTILFGIAALLLMGCNSNNASHPDPKPVQQKLVFDQLIGTWKSEDDQTFERWTKAGDQYRSDVYMLEGKDTSFLEHAQVYKSGGKWVFENIVTGQNDGKKILFTAVQLDPNMVEFSNPEHDFPTSIHYGMPDANTIYAFITGKNEAGGSDTIPFNYTRID